MATTEWDALIKQYGNQQTAGGENPPAQAQSAPANDAAPSEWDGLIKQYGKGGAVDQERAGHEAHPYLSGVMALASGADDAMLNLPSNAAAGIRSYLKGTSYDDEYAKVKGSGSIATEFHPMAYGAGMAGGVAAGIPLMPEAAPTMAGRALQGAKIGAAMSGVGEFADSKDPIAAVKAAGIGGALGGVAAPAIETAINTGMGAAQTVGGYLRGARNPEEEAVRRVANQLAADRASGVSGLTDADIAAAQANGQQVFVGDMGGERMRALARSAANTSPEARQALQEATQQRFYSQNERIGDYVQGLGTGQSAGQTREQLQEAARLANKPAYDAAYNAPHAQSVWGPDLERLMAAPDMQEAAKGAVRTGRNRAALEGAQPVSNPFTYGEDGAVSLTNPNVTPNLRFWDAAKQNLDDRISSLGRAGEKQAQTDAIQLKSRLVSRLDQSVPEYASARSTAAKFFGADTALTAGEKFATASKMDLTEARKSWGKMSQAERALFADGFASKLADTVRGTNDRVNVINKIASSPDARERLKIALGNSRADELMSFLHVEHVSDQLRQAVSGNSTTARQLHELGMAGGAEGAGLGFLAGVDPTGAGVGGALLNIARSKIDGRVAEGVGKLLLSEDPKDLMKVARMAAKNEKIGSWVQTISTRIGGVGGQALGRATQ